MLSQEPKDGDFIRYVDALQAGKLAEIKAENRHLEMNDLSDEGWSKRVTAYLARGARRVEPAAPPGRSLIRPALPGGKPGKLPNAKSRIGSGHCPRRPRPPSRRDGEKNR